MKLILNWEQNKKEIETELSPDFKEFCDKVKNLFNLQDNLQITFMDADKDIVVASDKYDLEYMISNSSNENPLEVHVKGDKQVTETDHQINEISVIEIQNQKQETKKCKVEIEQEIIDSIKKAVNEKIDKLENKIKLEKNISTETLPLDSLKEHKLNPNEFFEDKEEKEFDFLFKDNQKKREKKSSKNCALDMAIENNKKIQELESKVDFIWEQFVSKFNTINQNVNKKRKNSKTNYEPQVHQGFYCDNCKVENFSGKRFSCLECEDLDLCEECENEIEHNHPMIRFTQPVSTNRSQQMNSLFKSQFFNRENSKQQKIDIAKALFGDRFSENFYEKFVEDFGSCNTNVFVNKMIEILK